MASEKQILPAQQGRPQAEPGLLQDLRERAMALSQKSRLEAEEPSVALHVTLVSPPALK